MKIHKMECCRRGRKFTSTTLSSCTQSSLNLDYFFNIFSGGISYTEVQVNWITGDSMQWKRSVQLFAATTTTFSLHFVFPISAMCVFLYHSPPRAQQHSSYCCPFCYCFIKIPHVQYKKIFELPFNLLILWKL